MIGWALLGLLSCEGRERPSPIVWEDLVWAHEEDRQLVVDLIAYYDRTFPDWSEMDVSSVDRGCYSIGWCSPEFEWGCSIRDLLFSHAAMKENEENDRIGGSRPEPLAAGSWIWLYVEPAALPMGLVGNLHVEFYQAPTEQDAYLRGAFVLPMIGGGELDGLQASWRRDWQAAELHFSVSGGGGGGSGRARVHKELRQVLTSSESLRVRVMEDLTLYNAHMMGLQGSSSEENTKKIAHVQRYTERVVASLKMDVDTIRHDLRRYVSPVVFLEP